MISIVQCLPDYFLMTMLDIAFWTLRLNADTCINIDDVIYLHIDYQLPSSTLFIPTCICIARLECFLIVYAMNLEYTCIYICNFVLNDGSG